MTKRGGGGNSVSNARELKFFLKNRMWRQHWKFIVAIGGVLLAFFASILVSSTGQRMQRLNVDDAGHIHAVFKSGDPWMILCVQPSERIPKVFEKAAEKLDKTVHVGVMDCTQKLPSGKSVVDRFGLKFHIAPTVFTVANEGKPSQIFLNHLKSSKVLRKQVQLQTTKRMLQVQSTEHLRKRCLNKNKCVLIVRSQKFTPYEKQWLQDLMEQHRKTPFVWLDHGVSQLKLKGVDLPSYEHGQHRLVVLRSNKSNQKQSVLAKTYNSHFDFYPLKSFLQNIPEDAYQAVENAQIRKIPKPAPAPQYKQEIPQKEAEKPQQQTPGEAKIPSTDYYAHKVHDTDERYQHEEYEEEEEVALFDE